MPHRLRQLAIVIGVANIIATTAVAGQASANSDRSLFQGRWVFTTFNGKPAPAEPRAVSLVISGDSYQHFVGTTVVEEGRIRLDVSKTPNWIDLVIGKGEDTGRVQPGFVTIEGDEMVLSLGMPGQPRPASKKAARLELVARRVK